MTSVNLPRDDAALIIKDKPTDRPVQAAEPYPRVQPVTVHADVMQAPPRKMRKQNERRARARRQHDDPVLLDTRSSHDRRNAADQKGIEVEDENTLANKTGVDFYT